MVRLVQFDRLKPCDPNTRFDDLLVTPSPTPPPHVSSEPDLFDIELLDSDDGDDNGPPPAPPAPTRYPARTHPNRHGTYIEH